MDTNQVYNIRLPNGHVVEKSLSKIEVEYWTSIGMFLAHGFMGIQEVFHAEQIQENEPDNVVDIDTGDVPVNDPDQGQGTLQ